MNARDKACQELFAQVSISNNIAISLVAMLTLGEWVRECRAQIADDQPLPPSLIETVETQITLLAAFSQLAGIDPEIARKLGDVAVNPDAPLSDLDIIGAPLLRFVSAHKSGPVH